MASKIKGITVEIGGDTTGLDKALSGVNSQIRQTQSNLKDVEKLLKLDPGNTELLEQKQRLLAKSIEQTADKLEVLKQAQIQAQKQLEKGEIGQDQFEALQREVIATEKQMRNYEASLKDTTNQIKNNGIANKDLKDSLEGVKDIANKAADELKKIGSKAMEAAKELDEGYDTIAKKTGTSGQALENLSKIADKVYGSMAVNMNDVGDAIGEINTRFGAEDEELEELTRTFLKFADVNNADVTSSVTKVNKAMVQWGKDSSKTSDVLDVLTVAGQRTGVSMDTLLSAVNENGATFKELGFSMEETVGLMAQFEANGVDASTAVKGLKTSLTKFKTEGKSLNEALSDVIGSIKNASTETDALNKAAEIFGTRGAATMASAIRDGRLDIGDLTSVVEDYNGAVSRTYEATQDVWDKQTIAMNKAKTAGSKLGQTIFTTLEPAIDKVSQGLEAMNDWLNDLDPSTREIIVDVGLATVAITAIIPIISSIKAGVVSLIATVKAINPEIALITAALGGLALAADAVVKLAFPIYETYTQFGTASDAVVEAVNKTDDLVKNLSASTHEVEASYGVVKTLADKYFELADKTDELTESEREMMKVYAQEIVKECPELKDQLDEVTGAFTGQKDEVYKTIDSLKEYAKAQAMTEILKEMYKQEMELGNQIKAQQKNYNDLSLKVYEQIDSLDFLDATQKQTARNLHAEYGLERALEYITYNANKAEGGADKLASTLGVDAQQALNTARDFEELAGSQTKLQKEIDIAEQKTADLTLAAKGNADAIERLRDDNYELKDSTIDAKNAVSQMHDEIEEKYKRIGWNATTWGEDMIDNFVQGMKNSEGKLGSAIGAMAGLIQSQIGFSEPEEGPLSNFHTFAPDMIDLFTKGIYDNMYKVDDAVYDMANHISTGVNAMASASFKTENVVNNTTQVYLGNKELTNVLTGGVVKKITNDIKSNNIVKGGTGVV